MFASFNTWSKCLLSLFVEMKVVPQCYLVLYAHFFYICCFSITTIQFVFIWNSIFWAEGEGEVAWFWIWEDWTPMASSVTNTFFICAWAPSSLGSNSPCFSWAHMVHIILHISSRSTSVNTSGLSVYFCRSVNLCFDICISGFFFFQICYIPFS